MHRPMLTCFVSVMQAGENSVNKGMGPPAPQGQGRAMVVPLSGYRGRGRGRGLPPSTSVTALGVAAPAGAWGRGAPPGLRGIGRAVAAPRAPPTQPQTLPPQAVPQSEINLARNVEPRRGSPDTGRDDGARVDVASTAANPAGDSVAKEALSMETLKDSFNKIFGGQPPAFCHRQQPGNEGRPIDLHLNMFDVKLPSGFVYHYDVEIFSIRSKVTDGTEVPLESKSRCAASLINRKVIDSFSRLYRKELDNARLAFDGSKNLYTRQRLRVSSALASL